MMPLPIVGGQANGYRQRPSGNSRHAAPTVECIHGETTHLSREHANFGRETLKGYAVLAKVGSVEKGTSSDGIYDLAGNVWEWVAERYDEHYYQHSPEHNPQEPTTGPLRALRGKAWNSPPTVLGSANRNANRPSARRNDVGFRWVQNAPQ